MAFAQAYFDESGTGADSPFLCVAGYVFTNQNALEIEAEWLEMLSRYDLPYFHMTECNQHSGIYRHLSEKQCIEAATEAIKLTKRYAARGIAVSIDKKAFDLLPPQTIWRDKYSFLCSQVMFGVVKWAVETRFSGDVEYVYESGAEGWASAQQSMKFIRDQSTVPCDELRFRKISSMSKKNAIPLQCADLLAWNWRKLIDRETKGISRVRGDFKNLLKLKADTHHYDKAAIDRWVKDLNLAPSSLDM